MHKKDCYFYLEVQEMDGHISTCNFCHKLGYCPCDNCDNHITKGEVYDMVCERIKSEKEPKLSWVEDRTEIVCPYCHERFNDDIVYIVDQMRYCPACGKETSGERSG